MIWFSPKLEPGERLLAVAPQRWILIAATLYFDGLVALAVAAVAGSPAANDTAIRAVIAGMALLAVGLSIILARLLRWRIAVTDRRAIVRRNLRDRTVEEMARVDIESVRQTARTFEIRGAGRTVATGLHPLMSSPITALLSPDEAGARPCIGPFKPVVDQGERVLFKYSGDFPVAIRMSVLAAVPLPALIVAFWFIGPGFRSWLLFVVALSCSLAINLFGLVTFANVNQRWLVTDRRVLAVTGLFCRRVEALPLDANIEAALNESGLTVRHGEKTLQMPIGSDQGKADASNRIRAVIEAARPGAQP